MQHGMKQPVDVTVLPRKNGGIILILMAFKMEVNVLIDNSLLKIKH